jgi:hypothetical protein
MAEEQNSSAGTFCTYLSPQSLSSPIATLLSAYQLTNPSLACRRRRPHPRNPRHRATGLSLSTTKKRRQRSHKDAQQRHLGDNNPRRRHHSISNPATPSPPLRGQKRAVRLCPQQDGAGKSVWCVQGGYRDEHHHE